MHPLETTGVVGGFLRGGIMGVGVGVVFWENDAIMAGTLCSRDMWWRAGRPAQALLGAET